MHACSLRLCAKRCLPKLVANMLFAGSHQVT